MHNSQVQILLNSNLRHDPKRRSSKKNPFVGLLYCGNCGSAMSLAHTKRTNKRYLYFICTEDSKRNFKICPVNRIPVDIIQNKVLEQLAELLQSPTLIAKIMAINDKISAPKLREILKNIHDIWGVMCHVEQVRFLRNLVSKILVFEDRIEIEPNVDGIKSLLQDAGVKVKK